jgi:hypothetical protein
MAKPLARQKARELRAAGMPYKRIAAHLRVSPSSAYAWTSDIQLTEEQKAANLRGPRGPLNPEDVRKRAEAWSVRCRRRRAVSQDEGRAAARGGHLLHLAGCMLWLDLLNLPKASARGHMLNHMPTSSSGRAKNKLPYGVARLSVHQTEKVQHVYGAIQEYAGFEEPAWLDCSY